MKFQAVFLDRDGVINEEVGIVRSADQLCLIPGSAAAIARLNRLGLPVVVVTNQPVVARGWCSEVELAEIHAVLGELLAMEGARLSGLYYCPHHENANLDVYRRICDCRKPRPGLLLRAARDFDLDLARCVVVGDRTVDLQAAREAGASAFLVKTGYGGADGKCPARPDRTFEDLNEAVKFIETCQLRKYPESPGRP